MKRTAWKAALAAILVLVLAVGLGPGVFAEEDVVYLDPVETVADPAEDGGATPPTGMAAEEEATEPETEEETEDPDASEAPGEPGRPPVIPPKTLEGTPILPAAIAITGLNPGYYAALVNPVAAKEKELAKAGTINNIGTLNKDMFLPASATSLVPQDIIDYKDAGFEVGLRVTVSATVPATLTKPVFTAALDTVALTGAPTDALTYDLVIPDNIAVGTYSLDIELTATDSLTKAVTATLIQKVELNAYAYVSGFAKANPIPIPNTTKYDLEYGDYEYEIRLLSTMFTRIPADKAPSLFMIRDAFDWIASSSVDAFTVTIEDRESGGSKYPVINVKADPAKIKTGTPYEVAINAVYKDAENAPGAIPDAAFPTQTITFLPEKTPGTEITGFASGANLGYDGSFVYLNGDKDALSKSEAGELELEVGDYVDVMFTPDLFSWGDGDDPPNRNYITGDEADDADLELVNVSGTGSTYADAELIADGGKSYIRVTFDGLTGTTSKSIDLTVGLKLGSGTSTTTNTKRVTLKGDLDFKTTELFDDEEYVELSEGEIVIAPEASLRNVELALDYNITLVTDLTRNRRTWVTVTEGDLTSADERMLDKYWEIEYVYTFESAGLSRTRTTVYFDDWYQDTASGASMLKDLKPTPLGDIDAKLGELLRTPMRMARNRLRIRNVSRYGDDRLYVYKPAAAAQTLVYLGTTDRGVEFSSKYYLSSERIEGVSSAGSSSSSGSSGSGAYVPPSSGGSSALTPSIGNPSGATPGGVFPANPNFNPNNGY